MTLVDSPGVWGKRGCADHLRIGASHPTILVSATHLGHFNKGLGDKIDSFMSDTIRGTRVSISDM